MKDEDELRTLKDTVAAQQSRGGLILLAIACTALVAGFAAVSLVLVTLQQLGGVTEIAIANRAKIESLEKSQRGLDAFIAETRARWIDAEKMQDHTVDLLEAEARAHRIKMPKRPERTPPAAYEAPVEPEATLLPSEAETAKKPWWRLW